jgi:glycine cleavage system H lipoate-binding protein
MNKQRHSETASTCVWTDAGVIRDRLCNRHFACEYCPLDAALRNCDDEIDGACHSLTFETIAAGVPDSLSQLPTSLLQPFLRIHLCNECRYSTRHVWLRGTATGQYCCGLDAFGAALFPGDARVVAAAREMHVEEGEAFAWIYAGDHVIPVSAPFSGVLTSHFHNAPLRLADIADDPYSRGALVQMLPDDGAIQQSRTCSAIEQASRLRQDAHRLLKQLGRTVRQVDTLNGICLNDGGVEVSNLRELLGDRVWTSLVSGFLCGE